jgi:hypothetical protein
MTMINIDDVSVVYEGAHRLTWTRQSSWINPAPFLEHTPPAGGLIGSLWPDKGAQRHICRQIDQGRRTVVIFDGRPPIARISRKGLRHVPAGAVEIDGVDQDVSTLFIPPLNWLSAEHSARGAAFSARVRQVIDRSPRAASSSAIVEDHLIGTQEPLRFIFRQGATTISELRAIFDRLYKPELHVMPSEVVRGDSTRVLEHAQTVRRRAA